MSAMPRSTGAGKVGSSAGAAAGSAAAVTMGGASGTGVARSFWILSPSSRSSTGFLRKPWMGADSSRAGSTESRTPAIMAMGMREVEGSSRSRPSRVHPSMPIIEVSTRATSKSSPEFTSSSAASPLATQTRSIPVELRRVSAILWMLGLSSTRRRRGMGTSGCFMVRKLRLRYQN